MHSSSADEPDFDDSASHGDEDEVRERDRMRRFYAAPDLHGGRNKFFVPHDGEGDGSGRLLAAIEVPDLNRENDPDGSDEEEEPVLLECLDARWAAEHGRRTDAWLKLFQEAPLSVLQLSAKLLPPYPEGAEPGDIAWFELDYQRTHAREADGRLYTSLFGAGMPVRVQEARSFDIAGHGMLGKRGFLHVALDASPPAGRKSKLSAFKRSLKELGPSFGVAVYDVGQGNSQALVHANGHQPLLYVDLGGGVLYNRLTFPKDHQGFCFSLQPDIVLSHWDWDHWSSAYRFPGALNMQWIAPPVPDTPIQQAFAADLFRRGNLQIWEPPWPNKLQAGGVRVERCTGKTSNDSGLAVTLYAKRLLSQNCLLPGDADYRFIPSVVAGQRFNAICMAHHGGRLHSAVYPRPKRGAASANSSGPRNSYKHPLLGTLAAHLAAGWPLPVQTGFSGQRPCHVLMPWGSAPHLFRGRCPAGRCATAVAAAAPPVAGVSGTTSAVGFTRKPPKVLMSV